MQKIYPNYSTPKINDPRLLTFSQMVGNEKLLAIPFHNELLPIGNCYWNVEYMAKKYGGSIIYGWIYNIWEGILIDAMHHAIWQTPSSSPCDLAAKLWSAETCPKHYPQLGKARQRAAG